MIFSKYIEIGLIISWLGVKYVPVRGMNIIVTKHVIYVTYFTSSTKPVYSVAAIQFAL